MVTRDIAFVCTNVHRKHYSYPVVSDIDLAG